MPPTSVTIVAGGDVMAQRTIKLAARWHAARGSAYEGWSGLLEDLKPAFRNCDLAFCNLETPILPQMTDPLVAGASEEEYPKFFGPTALVTALQDAGLTLLSVANNHAHDMGAGGIDGTVETLQGANLSAAGLLLDGEAQVPEMTLGRWTMRVLGATTKMNKTLPHGFTRYDVQSVEAGDSEALVRQVEVADKAGRPAIVSLHWGREWGTGPDETQRSLAHHLCEAGATLVLGHHSHVAQPVEVYRTRDGRTCLIAWSLGNLLAFEADHPNANLGLLLRIRLEADAQGRPRVAAATWQPTWSRREGECIRVIPLDSGTDAARRALADPACQRELRAAEQRVGPRTIKVPND